MPSSPVRDAAVVILAAGKGTRMRSDLPKVLHRVGNAPLLHHVMRTAQAFGARRTVVVAGYGADQVQAAAEAFDPAAKLAIQDQQLGTGHAVLSARAALQGFEGDLYVLYADTPFVTVETLFAMQAARERADIAAVGFKAADPGKYGRFILGEESVLEAIVEAKDATPQQLAIDVCNSGLMAGDCQTMLGLLDRVGCENAQGEYYLTDVIGLARGDGLRTEAVLCAEAETQGINDRIQLAAAEAAFQSAARTRAMADGATLLAPETVYFSADTALGRDVVVEPNVVFGPGVRIGDGCVVKAFCHLEDTHLAADVQIGPFARARGGTDLATGVRIGNFVELKKARVGQGSKAGHLSYLGDATLGAGVNIGAGTITCNYDGINKHQTVIDDGAFIGVQTALVAPRHVGKGAYTATGGVLTEDVPDDALAIARARQVNKPQGSASRLRQMIAAKAKTQTKT
ncbi:MAG: bifunctional UDP-N-acetylglucosamine diphosphorylase/glucosamine-1-phosphate N-acetyltransferase GlmU [Pseudomonadota bacterium]